MLCYFKQFPLADSLHQYNFYYFICSICAIRMNVVDNEIKLGKLNKHNIQNTSQHI